MHRVVNGVKIEMTEEECEKHLADQEAIEAKRLLKRSRREEEILKRHELMIKLSKLLDCKYSELDLLFSNQRYLKINNE